MKILKKLKYNKASINAIVLLIWTLYLFLLSLNFFSIIIISWFWILSPLWIIPIIIVLIGIAMVLLTIIF